MTRLPSEYTVGLDRRLQLFGTVLVDIRLTGACLASAHILQSKCRVASHPVLAVLLWCLNKLCVVLGESDMLGANLL